MRGTAPAIMRLTTIKLLGAAGRMFGRVHRLAVSSPAEAVRALCTIHPGFHAWVLDQHDRGVAWRVITDTPYGIGAAELQRETSADTIVFAPVVQGAGGNAGSVFQIVLGVALIALSFVSFGTTALAGALSGGWGSVGMGFIGVGLLLGGIAQLITPTPKKPADPKQSNLFTRNSNDGGFGEIVPVLYGQRRVRGPRVINFDLSLAGDRDINRGDTVGLLGYVNAKDLDAAFPPDPPPTPGAAITITQQPVNASVTSPNAASFTVVASTNDGGVLGYQWQVSTNGGTAFTDIQNTGIYTGANSVTLNISNSTGINGYIYKVRITSSGTAPSVNSNVATLTVANPTDPSFANVILLLQMDGADGSTVFTDTSSQAGTVSRFGNTQISTFTSVFGGASAKFDGTGDYLTLSASSLWNLNSGDFTIELFVNRSDTRQTTIISQGEGIWRIQTIGAKIKWVSSAGGELIPTADLLLNRWYHVAVIRKGSSFGLYFDGVQAAFSQAANVVPPSNNVNALWIGRNPATSSWDFGGYMDSIRITKGVARYTTDSTLPSSFTVPTVPFSNV